MTHVVTWDVRFCRFTQTPRQSYFCHGDNKMLRTAGVIGYCFLCGYCLTDPFLLPRFPPAICDAARVSSRFSTQRFYTEDDYFKYLRSLAHKPAPCLPLGIPTTEANDSQRSCVSPNPYKPGAALGEQNRRRNAQIRSFLCAHRTSLEPRPGN